MRDQENPRLPLRKEVRRVSPPRRIARSLRLECNVSFRFRIIIQSRSRFGGVRTECSVRSQYGVSSARRLPQVPETLWWATTEEHY